jgi:hypothetical protein
VSRVSRSIPGLFGGVSQQIPAMRHATQCSEQDNGVATLVDGLFKRPGTKHLRTLALTGPNGQSVAGSNGAVHAHVIDKGPAALYQLLLANGSLMLYSMTTGAVQTVSFPNGNSYLTAADPETDFRCVTVADYTFIVNRAKKVAMKPGVSPANPTNVAYINVKTAVPKTYYTVTVDGVPQVHYAGDEPTNATVASGLRMRIASVSTVLSAVILPNTNLIKVTSRLPAITCAVSDSWGNQAMQMIHHGVDSFSQLPAVFEPGYVVSINGTAESNQDTYYVRWDGVKSRWEETMKPGLTSGLDGATMPHQLRPDGTGGWVFEQAAYWGARLVGDEDSNPEPSFVGRGVRGVFFFRNRLGFLAGDALCLSRAGSYFDFWASTATQVLDNDPIDLAAPAEQVETLDWAVPYNQTLLVWATSKQQFVLTGGDILSPNTARLQPSTTFESYNGVRPAALGNRVLFASRTGSFSQLNLYRVSEDTVTNTAEDVTEHCPNYVPANPRVLAASTTVKAAVVVPGGAANELYLFKYETDERDQMTQKAWCRLRFETRDTVRIMGAYWSSRTLYLLKHVASSVDPVAGGRFAIETLDFEEKATDQDAGFALRLDSRVQLSSFGFDGNLTSFEVPYYSAPGELVLLKCVPGAEPEELTVTSHLHNHGNQTTRLYVSGDQQDATVWAGKRFSFRYVFTEVFMRDTDGVPVMAASIKLIRMLVRYQSTGWFRAMVVPLLRQTFEYPFSGRTVGQPGQGASQLALSTGSFAIPVQAKAAGTEIAIVSDSWLPCKFPYAEWVGDVTMKAQR